VKKGISSLYQVINDAILTIAIYLLTLSAMLSAVAAQCGTVGHFFVIADNSPETYDKYGIQGNLLTTDPTICGTTSDEGSFVAEFIVIQWYWPKGWVSLGFLKGRTPAGDWTGDSKHYYYERCNSYPDCPLFGYSFDDISKITGDYPNNNDVIKYQLQGSLDTGEKKWYWWIEKSGVYTLSGYDYTDLGDYGIISRAYQESHNNVNIAKGHVSGLKNLKKTGTNSWTWVDWAQSKGVKEPDDNTNPYCYVRVSAKEYKFGTLQNGVCQTP